MKHFGMYEFGTVQCGGREFVSVSPSSPRGGPTTFEDSKSFPYFRHYLSNQ